MITKLGEVATMQAVWEPAVKPDTKTDPKPKKTKKAKK